MQDAKALLSKVIVWLKYAAHKDGRRETWSETVQRSAEMHATRFPLLKDRIAWAFGLVEQLKILPSMRSLQFAGEAIEKHESRLYNCCYAPLIDPEAFAELFFNLLCGTGTGYSVERQFTEQLPPISQRWGLRRPYVVEDSIEGWCDAVLALFGAYMGGSKSNSAIPDFDYSQIRPKGTPLKTTGGYAPGHEPLKKALENVEKILVKRQASDTRRLRPIDAHDIMCHLADAVYAGGIRRAAMICFFDHDDQEMLGAKAGEYWNENPQRGRANNSAVFFRDHTRKVEFVKALRFTQQNKTGEPGIYWTRDTQARSNPCVEAGLDPFSFCNLTTINVANITSVQDFWERCEAAAFIGTLQASYTKFSYLSERWKKATERSALLGVSMTGLASGKIEELGVSLAHAALLVKKVNEETAQAIGINAAHRTTLIKPEGTTSLLLGTASGLHAYHAPHYLRGIEIGNDEPILPHLREIMGENIVPYAYDPNKSFAYFPLQAPKRAVSRELDTALDLLERAKGYTEAWIKTGHRIGANTHNASITVSIHPHEWDNVIEWMWAHRESYAGIALLPYDGGSYPQTPFTEVDESTFAEFLGRIKGDFDPLKIEEAGFRKESFEDTAACVGGLCEV